MRLFTKKAVLLAAGLVMFASVTASAASCRRQGAVSVHRAGADHAGGTVPGADGRD